MNVPEYLRAKGMSINALHKATGIAFSTLRPHVTSGKQLSVGTAKKLETWSGGEMTAAEILGFDAPEPRKKGRKARSKKAPAKTKAPAKSKAHPLESAKVAA